MSTLQVVELVIKNVYITITFNSKDDLYCVKDNVYI